MNDPGDGGHQPPGTVVVPMEATAAAAAAAAAARPAWTRRGRRLAWAAALFLLGFAAAGLALFGMVLLPPGPALLGKACALPSDAEAARMRTASEYLLLAASAQVLAATMGHLVPAWPFSALGCAMGCLTAFRATDVLDWVIVACHGGSTAHGGALAFHFWLFVVALCAVLVVGAVVSMR